MVNKEWIKKWVEALRSGNYKQGKGALCYKLSGENDLRYCCLGVLTDLVAKKCKVAPDVRQKEGIGEFLNWDFEENYLPTFVMDEVGLSSRSPTINLNYGYRKRSTPLSHLNDDGRDFNIIADLIEKTYLTGDAECQSTT